MVLGITEVPEGFAFEEFQAAVNLFNDLGIKVVMVGAEVSVATVSENTYKAITENINSVDFRYGVMIVEKEK